jgi:hypothetical protein
VNIPAGFLFARRNFHPHHQFFLFAFSSPYNKVGFRGEEMEKLVNQYSGQGRLIRDQNESARVKYSIGEFQDFMSDGLGGYLPGLRDRRGRVSHAEGHPHWHPIIFANTPEALTLVLEDGRKLKVFLATPDGQVQATGDFF